MHFQREVGLTLKFLSFIMGKAQPYDGDPFRKRVLLKDPLRGGTLG